MHIAYRFHMADKTDDELQAYIDDLRTHGIPSKAARNAGMQLRTVKRYREMDEDFTREEELAQEEASDYLEEAARERAVDGVPEFKMVAGKPVEFKRVYSDGLLTLLLKGAKPDKYADRSKSELSAPGGEPLFDDASAAARISSLLSIAQERKDGGGSDEDELLQ